MSACRTGKQPHVTERSAKVAVKILRNKGVRGAHTYRCDKCRSWHVGSARVGPVAEAPTEAFARPRRVVPDDPKGTTYCPECGHQSNLHVAHTCLGGRGKCVCEGQP